ncbi:hypothetical protein, partial [Lactococcus petauri]|uniref:hypothetical protein n=1 Tax=Lactococcus petauri TaxID=1940789 RepID=UPI0021F1775E
AAEVKITDWITTSSSGNNGTPNTVDVSSIAELQNIGPGISVKIYIVPQGSGTGNYYLIGGTNSLRVEGTVVPSISPTITPS